MAIKEKNIKENQLLFRIIIIILLDKAYFNYSNTNLKKNKINNIIKTIFKNFIGILYKLEFTSIVKIMDLLDIKSLSFNKSKINLHSYLNAFLICMILTNKIHEKNFLTDLEKNYGVFLDSDNFIQEINQKIKEMKNISDYKKYFGNFNKMINKFLFFNCHSIIDKIAIVFKSLDYRDKKKIIIKAKKDIYINFNFYDCLYKDKKDKTKKYWFFFHWKYEKCSLDKYNDNTRKSNPYLYWLYKEINTTYIGHKENEYREYIITEELIKEKNDKEKRKIRDEEIINRRKKMKLIKNGNKKVHPKKGYKKIIFI